MLLVGYRLVYNAAINREVSVFIKISYTEVLVYSTITVYNDRYRVVYISLHSMILKMLLEYKKASACDKRNGLFLQYMITNILYSIFLCQYQI